jgi:hypothetical protein
MPLLEQHVRHPVVIRVDQEALDPPDLEGMPGLTGKRSAMMNAERFAAIHREGGTATLSTRWNWYLSQEPAGKVVWYELAQSP